MLGVRGSDLVAVRLPPGPRWIEVLGEAWDAGAAVLPIDHRLPAAEVSALLERARPAAFLDGDDVHRYAGIPVEPGVGLVLATSGSSGAPRLVELTHAAVEAAVRASVARLGATTEDAWLSCLPLAHAGGLLGVLRARALGAPLLFAGSLEPGARYASVVPTQLVRALDAGVDLDGFRAILVGGAALDRGVGAPVVLTYGMTESCGGVVYAGIPLEGVEVRIGDGEEIQIHGPTLMRGYRLDEAATTAAFTADGWLRTRDAGALVAGRLVVHGRLDDVIVTGGEKVWPEEVERALRTHPRVADAAVVGRPDAEWGARVVAYIVAAGEGPSLGELRDFVGARLARSKAPRELVIVDALPRTASGKVARAALP